MTRTKPILFYFFIILFAFGTKSTEALEVRHLKENTTVSLEQLLKGKTLWIFFRPDCSACRLLFANITCLKDLSKLRVVGFSGSEASLKKELRHLKKLEYLKRIENGPFYGEKLLLKKIALTREFSPQIFLFENTKLIKKTHGVLTCLELEKLL